MSHQIGILSLLAMIYSCTLDSSAWQERDFSLCSYQRSKLQRNHQHLENFKMKFLLAINRSGMNDLIDIWKQPNQDDDALARRMMETYTKFAKSVEEMSKMAPILEEHM